MTAIRLVGGPHDAVTVRYNGTPLRIYFDAELGLKLSDTIPYWEADCVVAAPVRTIARHYYAVHKGVGVYMGVDG